MFTSIKNWIKKYPVPFVILLLCALGIFNFGIFGYKFQSVTLFIAVAIVYGVFHIDGFWNALQRILKWIVTGLKKAGKWIVNGFSDDIHYN